MAFGEPLGEGARAVVQIPVERIHDLRALRRLQAERGNAVHAEDQPDQLLLLRQPELGRLLDRGDGVIAGIGDADDIGAGGLRLQQEGGVVGGAERMAHGAEHFAAGGLDAFHRLLLQIVAEGVIGGQEEPFLAALRDHGFAEAAAIGIGIVGPVHGIRRAFFAGEQRGAGAGADEDLVLLLAHVGDRERNRRVRQVEDGVDAFGVVPAPRDADADVGLVLVIGGDDVDGLAGGLAAIILHGHLRGDDRADALIGRKHARLVVEHADPDAILGISGADEHAAERGNEHSRAKKLSHAFPPVKRKGGLRDHFEIAYNL